MRLSLPRLKMPRLPGFGILVWLFPAGEIAETLAK